MSSETTYLPNDVAQALQLKKIYVKLKTDIPIEELSLSTIDADGQTIENIMLCSSINQHLVYICKQDLRNKEINLWFDVDKIPSQITKLKLIVLKHNEFHNMSVLIYNQMILRKVFEFDYLKEFMNGVVFGFNKKSNFFYLDQ